jgi:CubicO group peptidase (beta-lactamase class C family)
MIRVAFNLLTILCLTAFGFAQTIENPALSKLIDELAAEDQKPYQKLQKGEITTEQAEKEFREATRRNYVELKKIVEEYGFPTFRMVGERSSNNFWMMVQHSDFDVEFQERVLKLMLEAVKAKNASAQNYAYLVDRVRINRNQPQLYGTQLTVVDANKGYELKPVENPAQLDRRRAEIGLPPVKEYLEKSNRIFFELNKDKLNKPLVPIGNAKIALIDRFINAKRKFQNFNGNVLVAEKGKIVYQKSFGYADFKNKTPLTSESVFNSASVSKQFTAAAVMLAVERGLLNLDDPLAKYFPEIPYEGITLRQMLTHTSGLPEQNELMFKYWQSADPITNQDMLAYLIKYKPEAAFKPGEGFKYCNTGYSLAAMIVEKVTGERFQDFVRKNIFEPLDLRQTRFLDPQPGNYKTIPGQTENYIADTEGKAYFLPQEIPEYRNAVALTGLVGAGNVHSTTADLLKWQESLKSAKILKRASIEMMQSPQVQGSVDGSDAYGIGLAIKKIYGDTKIFHYGGTLGFWNSLTHFRGADRTIVVLTNNESENGLTNAIAAILFDQPVAIPTAHREIRLTPQELDRFAGTYQAASGASFSIEIRDGKILRIVPNGEPKELKAESKTKLFYTDVDRQIEFVFDRQRQVKQVFFIADGIKLELKKIK